jgi:tetratricopeptide (TPR) repeat protein/uncharacterized protein HemY
MSDQDDNDLDSEFDSIFSDLDAEPGKDEVSSKATVPPPAGPTPAPASRGLYRPSEPPPIGERVTAVPKTPVPVAFDRVTFEAPPPPAPKLPAAFDPMSSWDDDEPNDATRVVALPAEMLAALGRRPPSERPTAPPPAFETKSAPDLAEPDEPELAIDGDEPDGEQEAGGDDDEPELEFGTFELPADDAPDALSDLLGDLLAAPVAAPSVSTQDAATTDEPKASATLMPPNLGEPRRVPPAASFEEDPLWESPPAYDSTDAATPSDGFEAWPTSAGEVRAASPPTEPAPLMEIMAAVKGGASEPPPAAAETRPSVAPVLVAGAISTLPSANDEPELEFGTGEPELEFGTGEPELAFGQSTEPPAPADDDEPELEFDAPSPAAAATVARPDAGAEAARRSVRGRKKRPETFPLVGVTREALTARRGLLEALAHSAIGAQKAQLLTSAAELAQQVGEPEEALQLLARAHEADPHDAVALRALRQDSVHRGDLDLAIERLEAETRLPLSSEDKALTLSLLAELQLSEGHNPEAAEKSARAGLALAPRSLSLALLVAEACAARGDVGRERDALSKAAEASQDAAIKSALYVEAATLHEQSGATPIASNLFRRALDAYEENLSARLGAARTALALGAPDALQHIQAMEARFERDPVASAALRRFRALLVSKRDPGAALTMLGDAPFRAGRELATHLAVAAGDTARTAQAARAWAESTSGTDRAEAYLTLAEAATDLGDDAEATAAIASAAVADPEFVATRILRESLARRSGGAEAMTRVAAAEAESSAIVAAARLANVDAIDDEAMLLRNARESAEAPLSSDVIGFDVAAERGDYEGMSEALQRQADRTLGARQLSPLLALASVHVGRGDPQSAVAALRQANELSPGNPLVTRPLSRMVATESPAEAGALLLEEATAARGAAAAPAARAAADWLYADPAAAASALFRALEADPQSAPSAWALDALARRHGGEPAWPAAAWRQRADEAILELAADPLLRAEAALRLSISRSSRADAEADGASDAAAVESLCRALEECPTDPTLVDLVAAAAPNVAAERLEGLAQLAAESAPSVARLQLLRAASLHSSNGEHALAAARLRAVLDANPGDPLARPSIDRVELRAGEHARVAERRFTALRAAEEAGDNAAKTRALAALAELDLYDRNDASAATLTLRTLLEVSPGHVPTLRALERIYMDQGRHTDVAATATRLLEALTSPGDISTYLPFTSRLHIVEADDGAAGDALYLQHAARSAKTSRVTRRWLGAAEARQEREQATEALRALAELTSAPMEKATYCLRAAGHRSAEGGAQAAAAELGREEGVLAHPVAAALLGHYRATAGYALAAAEAFSEAAKLSPDETYAAAFWYEAGCLLQDKHEDERALAAFEHVVAVDITHRSVFARMRELLEARGANQRLAALISQRLGRGGDTETIANLHVAQATLAESMGDHVAAREALRAALALHPDSRESLERLARLCLRDEIWPEAEGTLIRWARLERNDANLRFIFFSLGDIYDRHIRQDARAEAAFQRVLKLAPSDLVTLDRIASLYQRIGKVPEAVAALQRMVDVESSITVKRDLRLRIGSTLEAMGQSREAEQAFEQVRRSAPTDIVVVRALASFFERQDARPALAMHLNRAVGDYRRAIEIDPSDTTNWVALVDVMVMRGRRDGARCAASAALALGITEPQAGQAVDTRGGVPGAGHAAADPAMKDFLAKDDLSHAALVVFEKSEEAFEKLLPLDTKALRLDKVLPKEHPVRVEASEAGRWFGFSDVHPRVTHALPRVCVPISLNPLTLVVGAELLETTNTRERTFLFARACEIAKAGLSVALRTPPAQLALVLSGLVNAFDPNYAPEGIDASQLADVGQRVLKALPRRAREELGPVAVEMAGRPGFDPRSIGLAAGDLGNRVALLATGDLLAALSALLKLNSRALEGDTRRRAEILRSVPETASLLRFAVSEEYLDARHRAGADSL